MRKIHTSLLNFCIIGIMEGILFALMTAFLLNYLQESFNLSTVVSYTEWLLVLIPCFGLVGGLFNALIALFLEDEEKPKRKFLFFRK